MKHTISADEYQELGKTYYKQKEYEKAIEAFTNGIEASVLPAVSLWDYRAASQLKLGDLNAAVKDGREAIRADKKDVRGYLRTGHALQKLDKLQTAVGIYKYGMKNVPITDNNFVLLQKLHNQLTRQLSPPKATDPFTVLPVELAELVVCFLPFKNVVNCLRVSRGWKAYLVKRPNLWLDLDLSEATKPVSRNFIRRAVQYSENGVTRLTVHRFQHTDVLLNISTVCKGLEEVEILSLPMMLADSLIEMAQCAVKLKKLIIHPEVTAATVTQILRHRPSLVHAEFLSVSGAISNADWRGPFPNLQTLVLNKTLTTHAREQVMHIDSLMERSPLLQNLTLSSWTGSISLRFDSPFAQSVLTHLELKRVSLPCFPRLPSTLKQLIYLPSKQLTLPRSDQDPSPFSWNNALRSHLPHLEYMVLRDVQGLSEEWLEALLDKWEDESGILHTFSAEDEAGATPLQHLWLGGLLHEHTPESLFSETGLLSGPRILTPALQSLSINGLPCTDKDVEMLINHPVALQTLDISSTKVSGASLKMLADSLSTLQYLKADNCTRISSRDAVVYAEKRGVTVSCMMTDPLGGRGGKKVRYG